MDINPKLAQLYHQKGEIITGIEILRGQLQLINEGIAKLKNIEIQQPSKKPSPKNKKAKKKKTGKGK